MILHKFTVEKLTVLVLFSSLVSIPVWIKTEWSFLRLSGVHLIESF